MTPCVLLTSTTWFEKFKPSLINAIADIHALSLHLDLPIIIKGLKLQSFVEAVACMV